MKYIMADKEPNLPAADSYCAQCNNLCLLECLKCQKCKRYIHTDCSNLPVYAIVNFFTTRSQKGEVYHDSLQENELNNSVNFKATSKTPRGTKQSRLWWNKLSKKLPELVKPKYLTNRKIRCATFTKIMCVNLARMVVTVRITTLSCATSIRLTDVTQ